MNDYNIKATLKHDAGIKIFDFVLALSDSIVNATERAIKMICTTEDCPETAIIKIEVSIKN